MAPRISIAVLALLCAMPAQAAPVSATTLLGVAVTDPRGERIGAIRDLAINLDAQSVSYAIVDTHDPSAGKTSLRAVPLNALRPGLARDQLVLDPEAGVKRDPAAQAPRDLRMMRATTILGMPIDHPTGADYGRIEDFVVDLETGRLRHAVVRQRAGTMQVHELPFSALRFLPSGGALLTLKETAPAVAQSAPPAMRASELIGKVVRNPQRDSVGTIEDLVIDIGNNRVHYAVLDMQRRMFAYPLRQLQISGDKELVLPETPDSRHELLAGVPSIEPRTGMALIRASELIGSGVENQPGVDLGKVVELVVHPATGKVFFAVVDLDPTGRSERQHAVPLDALAMLVGRRDLVLTVDDTRLQRQASFTRTQLDAGLTNTEFLDRYAANADRLTPRAGAATGATRPGDGGR